MKFLVLIIMIFVLKDSVPQPPHVLKAEWLGRTAAERCSAHAKNQAAEEQYFIDCDAYERAHPNARNVCPRRHGVRPECAEWWQKIQCENIGICVGGYGEFPYQGRNFQIPRAVWQQIAANRRAEVTAGIRQKQLPSEIDQRVALNRANILIKWVHSHWKLD